VVGGLLAVLLLPLAEGRGELHKSPLQSIFLVVTLAALTLNYLPTRLGPAAVAFTGGCLCLAPDLAWSTRLPALQSAGWLAIVLSPWLAWVILWRRNASLKTFDRLWLDFRDRYGLTWGLRVRDQFNRAATHAGWPAHLGWQGLVKAGGADSDAEALEMESTLRSMLKRFGSTDTPGE
jgi:hypothetical protein